MLYAKSDPVESIWNHTNKLLENLKILRRIYGDSILEGKGINPKRFWELLEIIVTYHDIGKVYTPFQNVIRKSLELKEIETEFDYSAIKHEQLSPLFIPIENLKLSKEEKKLVYQSIYYHHERNHDDISNKLVEKIIEKDILPRIEEIKKEIPITITKNPNNMYITKVGSGRRFKEGDDLYEKYCLLKGLLHRLDHSSSGNLLIEDDTKESIRDYTDRFMKKKDYDFNNLQEFSKKNISNNLLVIGSTGMGKTEAALLWSNDSKTFFTLPIRVSINAIYDRISQEIGYKHIGLLHSTALEYLEEKQEFENQDNIYEQSKNLCEKITVCTIDQIFTFVFKYKGYEKIYATLEYSKIVIDEIQAYSPEIVAVILKGIEMIHKIGGKFMIMTATLPKIYKEELEKMGIQFNYGEFIKDTQRHKIKLKSKDILEDIEEIVRKGKKNKVLLIANTVNKAIELYLELKKNSNINIHLLHSRFTYNDRSKKEKEIKIFSRDREEKGIWITTQIVEASLDIDFDYLYTEMSTLDSLFQRLGRCYRSRKYQKEEPNVFIYTKNSSGIGSVYDKEIVQKSIELLEEHDNKILTEKEKVNLVDKIYSKEMIEKTEFYKKFKNGMEVLKNIIDYDLREKEAQKLLRNIDNIMVIPKVIYDRNIGLFEEYEEELDIKKRNDIRRKINKSMISISQSQKWKIKDYLIKCPYLEEIFIINLKYNEEIGLLLEKDEEYDLKERFDE